MTVLQLKKSVPGKRKTDVAEIMRSIKLMLILLAGAVAGCSATEGKHALYSSVTVYSAPSATSALREGDLSSAETTLRKSLAMTPNDPQLNYTLGCTLLVRSDNVKNSGEKGVLRSEGWKRLEAASARFFPADTLLAHCYLTGRWRGKKDRSLYLMHMQRARDGYAKQGGSELETRLTNTSWLVLGPLKGHWQ